MRVRHNDESEIGARGGFQARMFLPDLPPNAVPSGTKGRILSSALAAFAGRGFHGTSIRTIADGVGINSATLYSHFASKEQILAALVEMGGKELLSRLEEELAAAHTSVGRLEAIVRATVVAHSTFPLLALVTNSQFYALSAELAGPARTPTIAAAALLHEVIEEGVVNGSFTLVDSAVTVHILAGIAQQIPMWMNPATDRPEQLADTYVDIARRIVGIA
jgi:AcrR family transcriptional regulator